MSVKYHLNMDDNIKILLNSFPQFSGSITRYYSKKQGYAVKLTIVNEFNLRFSLSVTMLELDGVYVDFGDTSIIEQEISVDNIVLNAISDVLNDKCIVVLGYKNLELYEDRKQYFDASFFDSDIEELNDMDEYHLVINKLTSPVIGIKRLLLFYKGIFEVSNWSGSIYKIIAR